jgi:hypothetical protein
MRHMVAILRSYLSANSCNVAPRTQRLAASFLSAAVLVGTPEPALNIAPQLHQKGAALVMQGDTFVEFMRLHLPLDDRLLQHVVDGREFRFDGIRNDYAVFPKLRVKFVY